MDQQCLSRYFALRTRAESLGRSSDIGVPGRSPIDMRLGIGVRNRTRLIDGRLQPIEIDDHAFFKIRYVNPKNGDWSSVNIETTWTWPEWAMWNGSPRMASPSRRS